MVRVQAASFSVEEQFDKIRVSVHTAQLILETYNIPFAHTTAVLVEMYFDSYINQALEVSKSKAFFNGLEFDWAGAAAAVEKLAESARVYAQHPGESLSMSPIRAQEKENKRVNAVVEELMRLWLVAVTAIYVVLNACGRWPQQTLRIKIESFLRGCLQSIDGEEERSQTHQLQEWRDWCDHALAQDSRALERLALAKEIEEYEHIQLLIELYRKLNTDPTTKSAANSFANVMQTTISLRLHSFLEPALLDSNEAALGHSSGGAFFPKSRQHRGYGQF